jgi:hypothetical protein
MWASYGQIFPPITGCSARPLDGARVSSAYGALESALQLGQSRLWDSRIQIVTQRLVEVEKVSLSDTRGLTLAVCVERRHHSNHPKVVLV